MILCVTPNPCVDKTVFVDAIDLGGKVRSQRYTCVPGGKGNNVARAVKALGHESVSMPIVGGATGRHVVDMIEQQDGVRCIPIWVAAMTRTITTVLEEGIHRQTAFFEPGSRVTGEEFSALLSTFREAVSGVQAVTFNGAVPDPAIASVYKKLIAIAHESGALTILDSYGEEFVQGLASRPLMVKPNLAELEPLAGFALSGRAEQWRAIDWLHGQGVELVVLSLGADGALVSRGGERLHAIPPEIDEVNAVGSGDALVAGFAIGLQEGWGLEKMARLGVAAGAANALSWDIGHFSRDEVEAVSERVRVERC